MNLISIFVCKSIFFIHKKHENINYSIRKGTNYRLYGYKHTSANQNKLEQRLENKMIVVTKDPDEVNSFLSDRTTLFTYHNSEQINCPFSFSTNQNNNLSFR